MCIACKKSGGLMKEFTLGDKQTMLGKKDMFVHTICALAFQEVFSLKSIAEMRFCLNNKEAIFHSDEAHKTLYGQDKGVVSHGKKYNTKCNVCKGGEGKLRVVCKRMTHKVRWKDTKNGP